MNKKKIKIAPSILSADFSRLGEQVKESAVAGADYIHLDIMDGHFVPNLTIGPAVVAEIRSWTEIPFEAHLMIDNPEMYVQQFVEAGANIITVHVEATKHLYRLVEATKDMGVRVGVSLNPATPVVSLEEIIELVDLVLVMTVNPGFGGQLFIEEMVDKIARIRQMLYNRQSKAELEVDGGITVENAPRVVKAGAEVLVAGSAIFKSKAGIAGAIRDFRKVLESAS